jgi:hypothetical protein
MLRKMVVSCGLTLAVIGTLAMEAAAQSSCAGLFSQCAARCREPSRKEPPAKCIADHCTPKRNSCRTTGCWTEGAKYGGAKHCNLKKS